MGDSAKGGFQPSEYYRFGVFKVSFYKIGVSYRCSFRSFVVNSPRSEVIFQSFTKKRRIVSNHGIHGPCSNPPEKLRFPETRDIFYRVNIRLGNNPNPISCINQYFSDNSNPDKRAVNISIPGYKYNVQVFPA